MKRIITLILLFFSVGLAAQNPGSKINTGPAFKKTPTEKTPVLQPLLLRSIEDSIQYALGAYMGQFMLSGGFRSIDLDYFVAGLEDIFSRRPGLIKDSSIYSIISKYQTNIQRQRGKAQEDKLFAALKDKPGIGRLPSGVQYSIVKSGKGPRALETDSVMINLKGSLTDGTVFEDTYAKKINITTTPSLLIPGLSEAIQLMPVGSAWEIYIPAALAYGDKGNGTIIPPHSALIITLELLEIKGKKG